MKIKLYSIPNRVSLRKIHNSEKVILLGDFNTRVGTDWQSGNSLEPLGIGKDNSNGLMLLEFYEE